MAEAMQWLVDAGVLKIETEGPPSRRYDVLVAARTEASRVIF
jgi:hypothetical protein